MVGIAKCVTLNQVVPLCIFILVTLQGIGILETKTHLVGLFALVLY
jgi:hypothetical protein